MGFCSNGLKNEFDTAMVNERSVFEPLKFYCIETKYLGCKDFWEEQFRKKIFGKNYLGRMIWEAKFEEQQFLRVTISRIKCI